MVNLQILEHREPVAKELETGGCAEHPLCVLTGDVAMSL